MRNIIAGAMACGVALFVTINAFPHCEIPCGIYDDEARTKAIAEHITTIEKSMRQIVELDKAEPRNTNQIVRWVGNKEKHATELQQIVTQYFMTQRVKPPADGADNAAGGKYLRQLTTLHGMLIAAMKAKQTTDLKHVEKLRGLLHGFREAYFGAEKPVATTKP